MKNIYEFLYKGHAKNVKDQISVDITDLEKHIKENQDYTFRTCNNIKIITSYTSKCRETWLHSLPINIKQEIGHILYMYANEINKEKIYTTSIDFRIILSNTTNNYILTFNIYKDLKDEIGYCVTKYIFSEVEDNIPDTFTIIKSVIKKYENQTIDDLVDYIKTANL